MKAVGAVGRQDVRQLRALTEKCGLGKRELVKYWAIKVSHASSRSVTWGVMGSFQGRFHGIFHC